MYRNKPYIYILTILSMLALSVSYVSYQISDSIGYYDSGWKTLIFFMVISTWGMPMIISLLGSVILSSCQVLSTEHILSHAFIKSCISCIVWWILAALIFMRNNFPNEIDFDTFYECLSIVLEEPYNIKILQIIVALFAFYPIIKRVLASSKLNEYAMITFCLMSIVFPFMRFIPYLKYIVLFTDQVNWSFFTPYGAYLFLGKWLENKNFEWHKRIVIYCMGILSCIVMYCCTLIFTFKEMIFYKEFLSLGSPLVMFQVLAVTVFVKNISDSKYIRKIGAALKPAAECIYIFFPVYIISEYLLNSCIDLDMLTLLNKIIIGSIMYFVSTLVLSLLFTKLPILSYIIIKSEE